MIEKIRKCFPISLKEKIPCVDMLIMNILQQLQGDCIMAMYLGNDEWEMIEKDCGGERIKPYRLCDKRLGWWKTTNGVVWTDYCFSVTRENYKDYVEIIASKGFLTFLNHYCICKETDKGIQMLVEVWDNCSFTVVTDFSISPKKIERYAEEQCYIEMIPLNHMSDIWTPDTI